MTSNEETSRILSQSHQTMEDDAASRVALESLRAYPDAARVVMSGRPSPTDTGEVLDSVLVYDADGGVLGDLLALPSEVESRVHQQVDLDQQYRNLLEATTHYVVTIAVAGHHGHVVA